jgi:hypothetical protein
MSAATKEPLGCMHCAGSGRRGRTDLMEGKRVCHAWEDNKQGEPLRRRRRFDSRDCMGSRRSGHKEEFIELV